MWDEHSAHVIEEAHVVENYITNSMTLHMKMLLLLPPSSSSWSCNCEERYAAPLEVISSACFAFLAIIGDIFQRKKKHYNNVNDPSEITRNSCSRQSLARVWEKKVFANFCLNYLSFSHLFSLISVNFVRIFAIFAFRVIVMHKLVS